MVSQLSNITMLKYKQKRNIGKSTTTAASIPPVLPDFSEGDPAVDQRVYRFFDQYGEYLGWCPYDTGRKFLLGKLYYKTKGAYRIRSYKLRDGVTPKGHKIHIYEKETSNLALYAVVRYIVAEDLIDLNDRESLAKSLMENVKQYDMTNWNYDSFPNKHNLFPETLRAKFRDDMQNFLASKKQELLNHLQDVANSYVVQRQHTETHGVNLADL